MEPPKTLKEIAPQLKEIILRRKVQKALQVWEDSLKTTAAIKRYYGVLNSIPVSTTGHATAGAGQGGANAKRQ